MCYPLHITVELLYYQLTTKLFFAFAEKITGINHYIEYFKVEEGGP